MALFGAIVGVPFAYVVSIALSQLDSDQGMQTRICNWSHRVKVCRVALDDLLQTAQSIHISVTCLRKTIL